MCGDSLHVKRRNFQYNPDGSLPPSSTETNAMELDQLISKAIDDPSKEPELFARLLNATLFVHAPKKTTGAKLSVVKFKTPQGILAIPVFTDREKAEFAGRGNVRILPVQGRLLLSATPGETVVINPNDSWCILYPEEIQAILKGQALGRNPGSIEMPKGLKLRSAKNPEPAFLEILVVSLGSVEHALDAWLTEATDVTGQSASGYVVVVAAESPHHERIARSLTLALVEFGRSLERTVDITFVEPGDVHNAWLAGHADCLIYRRAWLAGLNSGIHGNA